jgi:hypothetical protein
MWESGLLVIVFCFFLFLNSFRSFLFTALIGLNLLLIEGRVVANVLDAGVFLDVLRGLAAAW